MSPMPKQVWPNSAACWSPATPAIWDAGWNHESTGLVEALNRFPEQAGRRHHVRQHGHRHVENAAKLGVPSAHADVVEQRAGRIGGIGRVDPAAGELPYQPRVDGAEADLAGLCSSSAFIILIQ